MILYSCSTLGGTALDTRVHIYIYTYVYVFVLKDVFD